jgi:CRISPR-associated protein Cas2
MLVVSYDITDDLVRSRFCRMLQKHGAIRLQYSVYEVVNTQRVIDNMMLKIAAYQKHFTKDDSVIVFDVDREKLTKYGNAIHRDEPIVYF